MNRKYLLRSPIRIARLSRIMAKLIDLFIVFILAAFFYPIGVILSIVYIAICDALQNGQSVGKKIIGLRVISLEDGTPCSLKQSVVRNLPFIVPLFFVIIPLWGWIFSGLITIPLMLLEIYLLFKLDSGHRLGDVMADTTVMAHDGNRKAFEKGKVSWFENKGSLTIRGPIRKDTLRS